MEQNTITLSSEVKDAWGLPAVQVTYDFHPDDLANMRWILAQQVEILEAAGAKKVWTQRVEAFSMSRHLMGTCRMGDDPKTSVVDRNSRTRARQQPTATIRALAYRAADIIIKSRMSAG